MGDLVKISRVLARGDGGQIFFECPGCDMPHGIPVGPGSGPRWEWDGNADAPSFSPSIKVDYDWGPDKQKVVCHFFVKSGEIQFLNDCTHDLAGKTIKMVDFD